MDFKDRMIEAYERGECSYEGAYDHVRESMADSADHQRKAAKIEWERHSVDCPARAGSVYYCECGADPSRSRDGDRAVAPIVKGYDGLPRRGDPRGPIALPLLSTEKREDDAED